MWSCEPISAATRLLLQRLVLGLDRLCRPSGTQAAPAPSTTAASMVNRPAAINVAIAQQKILLRPQNCSSSLIRAFSLKLMASSSNSLVMMSLASVLVLMIP